MPNGAENQSSVPNGRLRTVDQALAYLGGVSEWKLRQLVIKGKLPVVLLDDAEGSKWRFDVRDLDGLIDRNKKIL
jgi:Helix-turn-helix domain